MSDFVITESYTEIDGERVLCGGKKYDDLEYYRKSLGMRSSIRLPKRLPPQYIAREDTPSEIPMPPIEEWTPMLFRNHIGGEKWLYKMVEEKPVVKTVVKTVECGCIVCRIKRAIERMVGR